jgi:hypothetical protein
MEKLAIIQKCLIGKIFFFRNLTNNQNVNRWGERMKSTAEGVSYSLSLFFINLILNRYVCRSSSFCAVCSPAINVNDEQTFLFSPPLVRTRRVCVCGKFLINSLSSSSCFKVESGSLSFFVALAHQSLIKVS